MLIDIAFQCLDRLEDAVIVAMAGAAILSGIQVFR